MSNSWKFALKKIIAEQLRGGAYPFKKDKNAKEGKNFGQGCCGTEIFSYLCIITEKSNTMPNKKDLKKSINNICSDIFAECVAMSLYHHAHEENVDALLSSILAIRDDFISRISHPEPGMRPKEYYDHLANSFTEQISEIIDQISNLSE